MFFLIFLCLLLPAGQDSRNSRGGRLSVVARYEVFSAARPLKAGIQAFPAFWRCGKLQRPAGGRRGRVAPGTGQGPLAPAPLVWRPLRPPNAAAPRRPRRPSPSPGLVLSLRDGGSGRFPLYLAAGGYAAVMGGRRRFSGGAGLWPAPPKNQSRGRRPLLCGRCAPPPPPL